MPPITSICFVTGNKNKLAEVEAILGNSTADDGTGPGGGTGTGLRVTNRALDLVEIQGSSLEEISRDKCRRAAEAVGGPVLTEDTCLCFDALKGLPGPYIKWFLQALGHDGLNKLLLGYEDKGAVAVCTFAFCAGPGQEPLIFDGRVQGKIVPARGPTNFGWDPIFEHNGETYAEMSKAKKNGLSHRALALAKLKEWLETQT